MGTKDSGTKDGYKTTKHNKIQSKQEARDQPQVNMQTFFVKYKSTSGCF